MLLSVILPSETPSFATSLHPASPGPHRDLLLHPKKDHRSPQSPPHTHDTPPLSPILLRLCYKKEKRGVESYYPTPPSFNYTSLANPTPPPIPHTPSLFPSSSFPAPPLSFSPSSALRPSPSLTVSDASSHGIYLENKPSSN